MFATDGWERPPHGAHELLLCCARVRLDPTIQARIELLAAQAIDWNYLLAIASRHGVTPLLFHALRTASPAAVPAEVKDQLYQEYLAVTSQTVALTAELLELLRLFELHGIAAIPFKGPVLSAAVYGDFLLRECSDLDLLVEPDRVCRARDLLAARGYRSPGEEGVKPATSALPSRAAHDFHLVHEGRGIVVELHWSLADRVNTFALDQRDLRTRLQPVELRGTTVPSFPPEEYLLFLCHHGAKHRWSTLKWLCDVAELIRAYPQLEWPRMWRWAREKGEERKLRLGLRLARDLLGAPLPAAVDERVEPDQAVASLARQVRSSLFERGDPRLPEWVRSWVFRQRTRERWRDRLPYYRYGLPDYLRRKRAPTAEDRAFLPLPPQLSCLYNLVRPFRLGRAYGRSFLRYLTRNDGS